MYHELDDLFRRLSGGDRTALRPAHDLARPIVRGFVSRGLRGHADVDDIVQEVLMKVFGQVGGYDARRPAVPWILAIAGWEVRTALKRHQRRRETGDAALEGEPARSTTPEDSTIEHELLSAAHAALDGLREGDRQAILLALHAADEGPARLPATLRKRFSRAVARLRIVWSETHGLD